jgi:hypothetical protein
MSLFSSSYIVAIYAETRVKKLDHSGELKQEVISMREIKNLSIEPKAEVASLLLKTTTKNYNA